MTHTSCKCRHITITTGASLREEWSCVRNVGVGVRTTADTQKPGGPSGCGSQLRGGAPVKLSPGRRPVSLRARRRAGSICRCGPVGAAKRDPDAARHEICAKWTIIAKRYLNELLGSVDVKRVSEGLRSVFRLCVGAF